MIFLLTSALDLLRGGGGGGGGSYPIHLSCRLRDFKCRYSLVLGMSFIDTPACHHYDVIFFRSHGHARMRSRVWGPITVAESAIFLY